MGYPISFCVLFPPCDFHKTAIPPSHPPNKSKITMKILEYKMDRRISLYSFISISQH